MNYNDQISYNIMVLYFKWRHSNFIHRESNHPPSIIKQLPLSVESCLSKSSSDENVFIRATSVYHEALKRVRYNHKLTYNNSGKYNSKNNNNNNKDNCNSNDTKNDSNYSNNKFKFNHTDNWDNNNNNNKNNFNSYENKDSNDNNNNKVKFNSNDNMGDIKNKDKTTTNNNNIESNDNNNQRTSKQRKRNIVWFNPPFSKNVSIKIGTFSQETTNFTKSSTEII